MPDSSATRETTVRSLCERLAVEAGDAATWVRLAEVIRAAQAAPGAGDESMWAHVHALFRNVIWGDIRAFWRAGVQPKPYLMYGPVPHYAAAAVSFDGLGMRTSVKAGAAVSYDDFLNTKLRRGVVIGNSAAAGVGVTHDAATVTSALNTLMPSTLWFNLAVGGHNLLQNALTLNLFTPEKFDYVVVCGGLIDFLGPLTLQTETPFLPSYIPPHQPDAPTHYDIAANGWSEAQLLRLCRRALEMILDRAVRAGGRAVFFLQPHLMLTEKKLSPEEACMVAAYERSAEKPIWKAHTKLGRYQAVIAGGLSAICADLGLDFLDVNREASFLGADWLYLDYIHLNDDGHARLAALIRGWADKFNESAADLV